MKSYTIFIYTIPFKPRSRPPLRRLRISPRTNTLFFSPDGIVFISSVTLYSYQKSVNTPKYEPLWKTSPIKKRAVHLWTTRILVARSFCPYYFQGTHLYRQQFIVCFQISLAHPLATYPPHKDLIEDPLLAQGLSP